MLALAWQWEDGEHDRRETLASRLGASLCAGIGGYSGTASTDGLNFAYRALRSSPGTAGAWRPTVLPGDRLVVFHGYFDNAAEIAATLNADPNDPALIYGLAVDRWADEADCHIVGDYCAVIANPRDHHIRLSRSPLRAPPLYYFHDDRLAAVASVPRALFAAGVERRLNESFVADSALLNFADLEGSWYQDISQVSTGSIVELQRGRRRVLHKWYDLLDLPELKVENDEAVIARVGELLDEGVRACLAGFDRPGATLSGGLDSPQVAIRAAAALPSEQRLPTFTFHPEPAFKGRVPRRMVANERPFVEAFAGIHPRLDPHFTANEGYGHDYRLNEFLHLIGGVPPGLCGMYVFHGLLSEATKQRCDVMLISEWGNRTFSEKGDCGFVEYFLKGNWWQLWLALTRPSMHNGSILRRFVARTLAPLVPNPMWRPLKRLFVREKPLFELMQPLSASYRRSSGVDRRQRASGWIPDRHQPRNRRHSRKLYFGHEDWQDEIFQGFEQMYGIAIRDPTAYRPFVEYCVSLPTKMFLRDGQTRWLAKQLAKGIMPEEQRLNRLAGWWDADWQIRIGRRREHYLSELDDIERDEKLGQMIDVPRLRAALEDRPRDETDPQECFEAQLAFPRALLTARFINYVEGRNTPAGEILDD